MKKLQNYKILIAIILYLASALTLDVKAREVNYVNETGTVTITGVETSDQLQAYPLIQMEYFDETNEVGHLLTNIFYDFKEAYEEYADFTIEDYYELTSGDITSGSTQTSSTLDKLISDIIAYIKTQSYYGQGYELTVSNKTATATLPAGAYIIIPITTERVYAPMVANIDYVGENGEWVTKDATVVAKVSDATISKTIDQEPSDSLKLGKSYPNYLHIGIPTYPTNATNKTVSIEETFTNTITFETDSLKIKIGENTYTSTAGTFEDENGNVIATSTFIDQKLTIVFNMDYINVNVIDVLYNTKLNEQISPYIENKSDYKLIYSNDPYGTGTTSIEDTYFINTFGIQLYKYDSETGDPLSNAVFEIYADEELTDLVGAITTGTLEDGVGLFHGLAQGTYYIVETKAPSGYKLIKDVIIYELDAGQYEGVGLTSLVDGDIPEGTFLLEIPNEKISFLPVTGGIGTIIYTLAGLIIVGGAFYYIKRQSKKRANI